MCDDFDDVQFGSVPQSIIKGESIKVKVQKDQRVAHHLQEEATENLNLLFYNFNSSNHPIEGASGTGEIPSTS